MKKIGFADYYISEWHADNYPAWFAAANQKLGLEYQLSYAWAERDISPVSGESTDEWCERMGVERCMTLAELCEKSDVIVVLAPSNPEKHLEYAKEVFSYKKPTYIDKTFAPNQETALQIFKAAEEYGTPFFSSSALRYSEELNEVRGTRNIILTGGGSNLEEYLIHQVEMAVSLLQDPVKRAKVETLGNQYVCHVETKNNAKAAIIYSNPLEFSVTAQLENGQTVHKKIESPFFVHLIEDMLQFFETGKACFDSQETLEVMRMRDLILKAVRCDGEWVYI